MPATPADAQPLWALVPPAHRARYLRRAATAVLDELDALADGAGATPLLESAAALLAGNAVALAPAAPRAAARMQQAFARAGLPEELLTLTDAAGLAQLEHVVGLDPPAAKGTMLVLDGAPLDRAVSGALWAAFAGAGRGGAGGAP